MTIVARFLSASLAALVLLTVCSAPVAADNPPPPGTPVVVGANKGRTTYTATVATNDRGVWIDVRATGSTSGSSATSADAGTTSGDYGSGQAVSYAGSGSSAGDNSSSSTATRTWYNAQGEPYYETSSGHVYHLAGINIGNASSGPNGWLSTGSQQHPGDVPESLYVDGHLQGIVWVPYGTNPGNMHWGTPPSGASNQVTSAPIMVDPRAIALRMLRHVPLPAIHVRTNPALGLVNVPGWFWAEGYNGQPFGGSVTVGSYAISVSVWPVSYQWGFGDGATVVSHDLGQPYPAESDIQHTYQYSSLRYPGGFPIQLTIQFAAAYSVNNGGLEALPGMQHTYTAGYPVQQLQSILTGS